MIHLHESFCDNTAGRHLSWRCCSDDSVPGWSRSAVIWSKLFLPERSNDSSGKLTKPHPLDPNPLSRDRDWTHILMDTSQVLDPLSHNRNSQFSKYSITLILLMLESCYQNPGSCWRSWRMNFVNTQAAGKQVFFTGKQIAPRTAGRGRRAPLSLLSYRGFYPLKRGMVPTWGPERCGFLPLALPSYLYQSLSNRDLRGGNVP